LLMASQPRRMTLSLSKGHFILTITLNEDAKIKEIYGIV